MSIPKIEEFDVLPTNFWRAVPREVQLTITTLDEFGLPLERRGVAVGVPRPEEVDGFSKRAMELVEATLKEMFS